VEIFFLPTAPENPSKRGKRKTSVSATSPPRQRRQKFFDAVREELGNPKRKVVM